MTDLPETIDPAELAYHEKLVKQVAEAREKAAQLGTMQQEVAAAEAAFSSWAAHLHESYGLREGDSVDEKGCITRGNSG